MPRDDASRRVTHGCLLAGVTSRPRRWTTPARLATFTAAAFLLTGLSSPPGSAFTGHRYPAPQVGAAAGAELATTAASAAAVPTLRTRVVMRNLDIPWDVAVLPSGSWIVSERDRERLLIRRPGGQVRTLASTPPGYWSSGETGLMSVVADPAVRRNDRFYVCTGYRSSTGATDVRVVAWRLNADRTSARQVDTLLRGIEITSGRHGGCRLRIDPRGSLWVGTGDATIAAAPQRLRSLNGKVLRLNRMTGRPWPSNPWVNAPNFHRRYLHDYGHRNVQGLAWRPGGGMWAVEHGPERDDEINALRAGGNYGWDPGPGYDESTPMTEYSLPGRQIGARWNSGYPTWATSGAVWVRGAEWGAYRGTLAVATLKDSKLAFFKFDSSGRFLWRRVPPALNGTYGRLRSVVQTANHDLLVTTSNGAGTDRVIRVHPS